MNYIENKTSCKAASLDAEKAFDKLWRDGLFFKLINVIPIDFWFILKMYYDSSMAVLLLDFDILSSLFIINCGVKQGGILSPFLFNIFINDLIIECCDANLGALIGNLNVCIIVYADDILLISSVDSHLQKLLDICSNYSQVWRIKFNSSKSNIIEFGNQIFKNSKFYINNNPISKVDKIEYLGVAIDSKLDFDLSATENFIKVQKSVFSLSFLGLQPSRISPFLQSFIYKTYCLSKFTYALETCVLKKVTRDYLNVSQNNLIRQIIGLNYFCHMSKILKILKLFNFEELYCSSKLSFLVSIKNNLISDYIFSYLCKNKNEKSPRTKSFVSDIRFLEGYFNSAIEAIDLDPMKFKRKLRNSSQNFDGISDSIKLCLNNIKSKTYKIMLDNLTKPQFIREDEEFQELLQYLIITGDCG